MFMEKDERQTNIQGSMGKMNPHSNWLGKKEGLNFMTSGNKQGLKLEFKVSEFS